MVAVALEYYPTKLMKHLIAPCWMSCSLNHSHRYSAPGAIIDKQC